MYYTTPLPLGDFYDLYCLNSAKFFHLIPSKIVTSSFCHLMSDFNDNNNNNNNKQWFISCRSRRLD